MPKKSDQLELFKVGTLKIRKFYKLQVFDRWVTQSPFFVYVFSSIWGNVGTQFLSTVKLQAVDCLS